jgi:hypothetical protein
MRQLGTGGSLQAVVNYRFPHACHMFTQRCPALRSRFTKVWLTPDSERQDGAPKPCQGAGNGPELRPGY